MRSERLSAGWPVLGRPLETRFWEASEAGRRRRSGGDFLNLPPREPLLDAGLGPKDAALGALGI